MKLIRKNNKKGFTLVELIVVIAIIAILALILIPAITGYTRKANRTAVEASARSLYSKAALHVAEGGATRSSLEGNLREDLPTGYTVTVTSPKDVATGTSPSVAITDTYTFTVEKGDFKVTVDQNGTMTTTPSK